jgi:Protein of unknown function (DUF1572)
MSLAKTYIDSAIKRLTTYKMLGEKTFEQLADKDFHYSPNEESNSIAVIIQHISGNMLSRWTNFLTEDGEKEWRRRDDEFEIHQYSKDQLLELWNKGWTCMYNSLQSLTEDDLMKTITIRNEQMPAIDAINRQLAHYPYHVGQIVYIGKILKNDQWKTLSIPRKKA